MKKLLLTAVVVLHVSLLAWLLLGVRTDSVSPAGTGAGGAELETGQTKKAREVPKDPTGTRETPGRTGGATGNRLDRMTFRQSNKPLPPELSRQTGDCRNGVLIDWDRREILWRKDAGRPVAIASLTKMMTMLLLMETIKKDPGLSLDSRVRVTREAAAVGGSQVYLDPRETFTLEELLKCVAIFSANDAAYLIAQYLGGGDAARFVQRMNRRAGELGLNQMHFYTPSGLPPKSGSRIENRGTAMEVAFLAARLRQYPEVVKWSSTWLSWIREKTPKPFQLVNRNRLVKECPGVIGMKTGFTQKAGFCVAAVCRRKERTLVAVTMGCASQKARNRLVCALLDWGYKAVGVTPATTTARAPSR